MIIIGEKINATRKAIAAALEARDEQHIIATAVEQASAGADYLDVNGGSAKAGAEVANMEWLVELIQAHTDLPLCIDSADPEAMAKGLSLARGKPILNSISLEAERLKAMLPIIADHECMVFALCMADEGTPTSAEDRIERAGRLVELLTGAGKTIEDIIIDPCYFPVSAEPDAVAHVCRAMQEIRRQFPGVHLGGGLSNISYGLPKRRLVNLAMLAVAAWHGMDAPILDPCTSGVVAMLRAAEVVNGADQFCMNYVTAFREGKL